MNFINKISEMYQGCIALQPPCQGEKTTDMPDELYSILRVSNGIQEIMSHPGSGEQIVIGWIIYPYEMIQSDTAFYQKEYQIDGTVFSDDGAGDPYLIKPDGKIVCFIPIDHEETPIADSLADFYK